MLQKTMIIPNQLGLHARASAKLTKVASQYHSEVWLSFKGRRVNGKSIMGVMMLAAGFGSEVLFEVDGIDEKVAMQALVDLINTKFDFSEQ